MTDVDAKLRRQIFVQFQMVATGQPAVESLAAAYDLTGALTAFICDTPQEAEKILRRTIEDMIRDVRANWTESRAQRAGAFVAYNGHKRPSA
jgi:hypothetical protein